MRQQDMIDTGVKIRKSRYCLNDNCSIVQIKDGHAHIFGKKIYSFTNPKFDWLKDSCVEFFYAAKDDPDSLNQAEGCVLRRINLNLLTGWELLNAFDEIDKQNIIKVDSMK